MWRAFSMEMFKLGEPVGKLEHQLLHGLEDPRQRIDHMNQRLFQAWQQAIDDALYVPALREFHIGH